MTLLASLLLLAGVAHAQFDEGSIFVVAEAHTVGRVWTLPGVDGRMVERWVMDVGSAAVLGGPRLLRARPGLRARCLDVRAWTVHVDYLDREDPRVAPALRDWEAAEVDGVWIDGAPAGLRLVWAGPDGWTREAWLLGPDYGPPLPSAEATPEAALHHGWERAYVEEVELRPGLPEEAVDLAGARVALVAWRAGPATPWERAALCHA